VVSCARDRCRPPSHRDARGEKDAGGCQTLTNSATAITSISLPVLSLSIVE